MPYTEGYYDVEVEDCFLTDLKGSKAFAYACNGEHGHIEGVQWLDGDPDRSGTFRWEKAFLFFKAHGLTEEKLRGATWDADINAHMKGRMINVKVVVDDYGAKIKYFNEPGRVGGNAKQRVTGVPSPFAPRPAAPTVPDPTDADVPY